MKVSLVFNPDAGNAISSQALSEALAAAGFHVVHVLENTPDLKRAAKDRADLILVAGGDGTVARAAVAMKEQPLPLAILPMGTANNIAASLGLVRPLPELIQRWKSAHIRKLDLGLAEGVGDTRHFVEGVGAGLITAGIAAMDRDPNAHLDEASESLERAIRTYRTLLASLRTRHVQFAIDGEDVRAEDLLLFEVLNTHSVGASIVVAQDATPDDGFFSVVIATEAHRGELERYLHRRLDGIVGHLTLPTWRARRVELRGWEEVHIDDEIRATPQSQSLKLSTKAAMVNVLV